MQSPRLLTAMLAFCLMTQAAWGQTNLGQPIAVENAQASYPPPIASTERRPRLFLGNLARRLFQPIRPIQVVAPVAEPKIPTRQDVARMIADGGYSPAEITAAKIKIDDAQAVHRRAAVRYLGTVDCQYYPEAELGLVAALRADRSEGVRYEAAVAMANGRGLTQRMLEAIRLCASGEDTDGNPGETSERVRAAAKAALQRLAGSAPNPTPKAALPAPELAPLQVMEWMPAPVMMPMPPWWQPEPSYHQHVGYFMPIPAPVPTTLPPPSPQEREQARTISTPRAVVPLQTTVVRERPFLGFLQRLCSGWGWLSHGDFTHGDPRLHGLSPLGSELALPSSDR